jgi:hypothetical protein
LRCKIIDNGAGMFQPCLSNNPGLARGTNFSATC